MLTSEEVSKIERDFADGDTGWMGDRASLRALLKDRAELQAEVHRFRSLVEAHEEVKAQLKAEIERLRYVEYEAMVMLDRMYPELYQTPPHLRPLRSALLRAERERERE